MEKEPAEPGRKSTPRLTILLLLACVVGGGGTYVVKRVEGRAERQARERLARERLAFAARRPSAEAEPLAAGGPVREPSAPEAPTASAPGVPALRHAPKSPPRTAAPSQTAPARAAQAFDRTAARPQAQARAVEFNRIAASTPSTPRAEDSADPQGGDDPAPAPATGAESRSGQHGGYVAAQGAPPPATGESTEKGSDLGEASGEPQPTGGGGGGGGTQPGPSTIPRISLLPVSSLIRQGETARLLVRIDNGLDVGSVPFQVQFDGSVLLFERAYLGEFFSGSSPPPLLLAAAMDSRNEVAVGLTKTAPGPGASGSGTLLTLEFRAIGPGLTPLRFTEAKLLNSKSREVPAQFVSSQITVR